MPLLVCQARIGTSSRASDEARNKNSLRSTGSATALLKGGALLKAIAQQMRHVTPQTDG